MKRVLQAEQALDLAPRGHGEEDAEREQEEDDDEEPHVCVAAVPGTAHPRVASCTVSRVAALDGGRIETRYLILRPAAVRWVGHRRSLERCGRFGRRRRGRRHAWVAILGRDDVVAEQTNRDRRDAGARDLSVAIDGLAAAGARIAESTTVREALEILTDTVARAARADVAVARARDGTGRSLVARAVSARSAAVAAELEGSLLSPEELPAEETDDLDALPEPVRRAAARAGATAGLMLPVRLDGEPAGSLELLCSGTPFGAEDRLVARAAAAQLALAIRALEDRPGGAVLHRERALELLGEALAVPREENEAGARLTRLAALATGAYAVTLWLADDERGPVWVASYGGAGDGPEFEPAVVEMLAGRATTRVEPAPVGEGLLATLRLGEPPLGALQLLFTDEAAPDEGELGRLATLGVRAAQSLRSGVRARVLALELERTRALLDVLGQAIAQLSLAHTLETAISHVSELLGVDRIAVYLREGDRLETAGVRDLAGPHEVVAKRLLDLALGPFRAQGVLVLPRALEERRLAPVASAVAESGIERVIAVPLRARDDVIGLLAVYPSRGRAVLPGESSLLSALAAQLAVAVQNARLHEESKRLGSELEAALLAERRASREVLALYEISGAFVEHLSLDRTLEAVACTIVEAFGVDAAAIRMVDRRRGELVTRAVHVAEGAPEEPLRALLSRPQQLASAEELVASSDPLVLDGGRVDLVGAHDELLRPFLLKGSTAAIVPVATKTELLATVTMLSLDPGRPITDDTASQTRSVAAQAALAIDNARLYQQQKDFAEMMQRTLVPQVQPQLDGFELGHVYESSAEVEVGGDVYDFLHLDDGRLAVVLGDVTGHGVDVAADMAMATFIFRTLAREYPEPASFLTRANEVLVGEIELGRFITMTHLVFDPKRGEVVSASAGHPAPRLVTTDGTIVPLGTSGLALGVEAGQTYEETRTTVEPGASVVVYTDGVIESRRGDDLYGTERLDRLLAARRSNGARELAEAVLADCRTFGGGVPTDDFAVVVVKRTA